MRLRAEKTSGRRGRAGCASNLGFDRGTLFRRPPGQQQFVLDAPIPEQPRRAEQIDHAFARGKHAGEKNPGRIMRGPGVVGRRVDAVVDEPNAARAERGPERVVAAVGDGDHLMGSA